MKLLLFILSLVFMISCSPIKQTCCKKVEKTEKTCQKTEKDKCCKK